MLRVFLSENMVWSQISGLNYDTYDISPAQRKDYLTSAVYFTFKKQALERVAQTNSFLALALVAL